MTEGKNSRRLPLGVMLWVDSKGYKGGDKAGVGKPVGRLL